MPLPFSTALLFAALIAALQEPEEVSYVLLAVALLNEFARAVINYAPKAPPVVAQVEQERVKTPFVQPDDGEF